MAFLLTHLPGFGENQWRSGVRSCLPLRGSSGFAPDSLYAHREERDQQSLHKIRQAAEDVNLPDVLPLERNCFFPSYERSLDRSFRQWKSRRTQ
jgi:hypothetical protein